MSISKQMEDKLRATSIAATEAGKQIIHSKLKNYQEQLVRSGLWRSCLNCGYWNDPSIQQNPTMPLGCAKFKALPPPHVIVHGCSEWFDDIPF